MILSFTVPGDPVSWARARRNGNRYFSAPKQAAYAQTVAAEALAARPKGWDTTGPMRVNVTSVFKRGKACKRDRHAGWHPTNLRHDADNIGKLVLDSCLGVVYDDDGQVVDLMVSKLCEEPEYGEPRIIVTVTAL